MFKKQEKNCIKDKVKKDNSKKDTSACCQFYPFICLVGEFCHFFITEMLACLNCILIIACNNGDIVLMQSQ